MAVTPEQLGYEQRFWDIPRIIQARNNAQFGWVASFKLSPTAIAPAVWLIFPTNTTFANYWDISFSTDTAIAWTLYTFNTVGDPGLTPRTTLNLGQPVAVPLSIFEAQVVAAPAVSNQIAAGFAAANSYTQILNKGWIAPLSNKSLVLATSLVAANCSASFYFTETLV